MISWGAFAQAPQVISDLSLLGTRSWIKVEWTSQKNNLNGFHLYWSTSGKKPENPSATINADKREFYIRNIKKQTWYYVWIESFSVNGHSKALSGKVFTKTNWVLNPNEKKELAPASSSAVPDGMELYWHDEFNDKFLNRNKWFPTYYSTIDYLRKEDYHALLKDSLPHATYKLNGRYIDLFVNDSLPHTAFFHNGKKVSSIQTYNWSKNENLLDDSRGGYFEVRVRRGSMGKVKGMNTAFWFDSPGPNLKYYLSKGAMVDGTKGIRPKGQLFEIDMFENLNAQFVMHCRVDSNGKFIHNLATDIAYNYKPQKYVPGKQWVTFGLLWTPTSIKHYINGRLIKSYNDKHHIYSPNHIMNVLLGSYGKGGTVHLQVDYIRYYRWAVSLNNELPNADFDDNTTLLPWHGTGTLTASSSQSGKYSLLLKPHQFIEQYVYLNNDQNYKLKFWVKGKGTINALVNNVQPVTGNLENEVGQTDTCHSDYSSHILTFQTGKLFENNVKTVRIRFINSGNNNIFLDHISVTELKK